MNLTSSFCSEFKKIKGTLKDVSTGDVYDQWNDKQPFHVRIFNNIRIDYFLVSTHLIRKWYNRAEVSSRLLSVFTFYGIETISR